MSNKPGFFRQLKDTQNYSTKFLIVLFSPNSGVTPLRTYWIATAFHLFQHQTMTQHQHQHQHLAQDVIDLRTKKNADIWLLAFFGIDYQHDYKRLESFVMKNKHTQCVILSLKATLVTAIINAITAL